MSGPVSQGTAGHIGTPMTSPTRSVSSLAAVPSDTAVTASRTAITRA